MLRRLEIDAVQSDLRAVEGLIAARDEKSDPIGFFQFSRRRETLLSRLVELGERLDAMASVALYFGGGPVFGSRGIKATFGAKAIESFQGMVTNQFASIGGPMGSRGPARQSDRAQLLVSDIARGSFGFVLEEAGDDQLVESPVKGALGEVLALIAKSASVEDEDFDALTTSVDERVLIQMTSFFKTLDDAKASIRLVSTDREYVLDHRAVERARNRVDGTEITDGIEHLHGRIYILPTNKRFELHSEELGPIAGDVHPECIRRLIGEEMELPFGFSDEDRGSKVRHRVIKTRNRADRHAFTLLQITGSDEAD